MRDDLVPQMAGAEEVVAAVHRREGAELSGLVLNMHGYERLVAAGLDRVNCSLAATESFNRRNGNASLEQAVERVAAILDAAASLPVTVTISCSFGCPFEGEVDPGAVADLCERLAAGRARPRGHDRRRDAAARTALVERVAILGRPVGLPRAQHAEHGLRLGLGRARRRGRAARRLGRRSRRLSFSPNATGNVATEDLVWQLERDGVATGVDLDALVETVRWLAASSGATSKGSSTAPRLAVVIRDRRALR